MPGWWATNYSGMMQVSTARYLYCDTCCSLFIPPHSILPLMTRPIPLVIHSLYLHVHLFDRL